MPVRPLPARPNLQHLKSQAKDLLRDHAARDITVAQRIREFHPRFREASDDEIFASKLTLSDAQLAVARERGFPSWTRLKRHIEAPTLSDKLDLRHHERIEAPAFRRAVDLMDAGDVAALREYLAQHPTLTRQRVVLEGGNYFRNPTLLEFAAENPVRHGKMPDNIVDVVRVVLDAGVEKASLNETLMLVATGSVAREQGRQEALIDLLCCYGADLDLAAGPATVLFELTSVLALLKHGAKMTLQIAAGLDRVDDARRLLPSSTAAERHLALGVAAQYGHAEIVRLVLDAGEDPNRFNPLGGHSHSTPLHQAALAGHEAVVRLFVERGAKLDTRDAMWGGTPADWAAHEGRTQIEAYLRAAEAKQSKKKVE